MWTPAELRRLIAQLAGLLLAIGGFVFLLLDIKATGHINVSSAILSGEVNSGSAGLFLLFLGFLLIALPIFWDSRGTPIPSSTSPASASRWQIPPRLRSLVASLGLAVVAFVLLFVGELLVTKLNIGSGIVLSLGGIVVGIVALFAGAIGVTEWVSPSGASTKQVPPKV